MVYVPEDRTVFTGDILFIESHPVIWDGPITNWIAACDKILSWDVETVVPGHGPITDKAGVRRFRGYLVYIRDEARKRFDAGLDPEEAARDISLDPYSDWLELRATRCQCRGTLSRVRRPYRCECSQRLWHDGALSPSPLIPRSRERFGQQGKRHVENE